MNTNLTSPDVNLLPLGSSGAEGGERAVVGGLAVLEHPIEWMRFCEGCESEQCFVAEYVFANGLFARCSKCGNEVVAAFTRTVGEAA